MYFTENGGSNPREQGEFSLSVVIFGFLAFALLMLLPPGAGN